MTTTSAVTHADPVAGDVLRRYARSFLDDSSIAVISAERFDLVRSNSRLAGWCVTDCATAFETPSAPAATSAELVIETSGTTGTPKMVRYSKNAIRTCADAIADGIPLDPSREYVALVNPRLAYGLSIVHSHLLAGVPVHFAAAPVSLHSWREFRHTLRPNSSVYLVPHQSFLLAQDESWSLPEPVEFIFAGGPFTELMAGRLRPVFPNATVVNMYGQAELGPRISIGRSPLAEFREGDVGKPLPGVQVRIACDAPDAVGPVEVASRFQMSSYFDSDGDAGPAPPKWWNTGDLGRMSANGHIHIAGRDAPDVNFLGSRVDLSTLRTLALEADGVLDCRVSAVDHPVYGQQPSLRVLTKAADPGAERRIRRALAVAVGTSASAVAITIVDIAALPDSGKL